MFNFLHKVFSSTSIYTIAIIVLLIGTPWKVAVPILLWLFAVSFINF